MCVDEIDGIGSLEQIVANNSPVRAKVCQPRRPRFWIGGRGGHHIEQGTRSNFGGPGAVTKARLTCTSPTDLKGRDAVRP